MTTAEDRAYYKKVGIMKYLRKRAIEDNGWYNNNLDTCEAYTMFRGYGQGLANGARYAMLHARWYVSFRNPIDT